MGGKIVKFFKRKKQIEKENKMSPKAMKLFLAMAVNQKTHGNSNSLQNIDITDIDVLLKNSLKGTSVNYKVVQKISEGIVEEYCSQVEAMHQGFIEIQKQQDNDRFARIDYGLDNLNRYLKGAYMDNAFDYLQKAHRDLSMGIKMLYRSIPDHMAPVLEMPEDSFGIFFSRISSRDLEAYNNMSINSLKILNNAFEMLLICEAELNIQSDLTIQQCMNFYKNYILESNNNLKMNDYNNQEGDFWLSEVREFYEKILKLYSSILSDSLDEIDIDQIIF